MTALDRLGATDLREVMLTYRDALKAHRAAINRLNVYPVPDGDTGTNMGLTLDSVVTELDGAGSGMDTTCKAISHGSLMGARGNSGVILSQVLRGIAGTFAAADAADAPTVAHALAAASEAADGAVMKPVEGTILTVVRDSARAAGGSATDGASLVEVLEASRDEAVASLARTPDLLPVLAEAGVVDAGAAGYVLLLESMLHVVDGRPVPEAVEGEGMVGDDGMRLAVLQEHADHEGHSIADLRYEVMYLLDAPDEEIDGFKHAWAEIGDSIVVVGGDGIWNCHVHTDDIGAAVEAGIAVGRPHKIRVTDLLDEVADEKRARDAAGEVDGLVIHDRDPVPTAVVAVATGRGVMKIFKSLGVRGIVVGGQTMNPSTAQLLEAVERVPAGEVIILPNNKNIVPVAEQVGAATTKTVHVVPTRSVVEGFAALIHYDPESSAADNAAEMRSAIETVVSGEVTQAVRESSCDAGPIAAGDFIGIGPGGIRSVSATAAEASIALLEAIVTAEHEIVTIIEGEDTTAVDTRAISAWLQEHRPEAAVEIHQGGQPLYPYLFGVE